MFPADQSFPSDYWVAIATVIPVFFLVIAVQGRTYEEMITASLKYLRVYFHKGISLKQVFAALAGNIILTIALLLILCPAASEVIALLALGSGTDTLNERDFAMSTTAILLVAVIIPPLASPIRALVQITRELKASKESADRSIQERGQRATDQQDSAEDESSNESDARVAETLVERERLRDA